MYAPSKTRAQELLSFNGFHEYAEGRWKRSDGPDYSNLLTRATVPTRS